MRTTVVLLLCAVAICAIDFRSQNTHHEFGSGDGSRLEEYNQGLNPYRQFVSDGVQVVPEANYILPSLSYVGQQFASMPSGVSQIFGNDATPTFNFDTTTSPSGVTQFHSWTNSSSVDFFATTLPPAIKITRQQYIPTTKFPIKLSKIGRSGSSVTAKPTFDGPLQQMEFASLRNNAHISVPSYRLLNDILVIPSSRRLYVLAIIPIHESSSSQGFECGKVDVNAFVRLAAFLKALDDVNSGSYLRESGLNIGAIVIDSCSSDLRTLADLYELLSGTNIDKSDIIAIIRDDKSYLPNIDEFASYLRLPTINTFFTVQEQVLTTGTLPTEEHPLQAVLDLLKHTQSTCVSVVFDDLHSPIAKKLQQLASEREMCLDEQLQVRGASTVEVQQSVVQKLLLSEARVVLVLYGERSWLDFIKAINSEMVISGRFVLVALQDERWATSRTFLDTWPHFDQLLLSVTSKTVPNYAYLSELTNVFPKLPFPQQWLRQFWTTAFQCHIDGERTAGEQFSRQCPHQQNLNLTSISPELNVAPITFAVHTVAVALRRLSDHVCPGALIHTLTDCLNDPYRSLFAAMLTAEFVHPLAEDHFKMNSTSGFPSAEIVVNRVTFSHGDINYEEMAVWDIQNGLTYTSGVELLVEERDGSRVKVASKCPKSSCASLAHMKYKVSGQPTFKAGLNNVATLIFSVIAILFTFVCLLCIYQQLVSGRDDPYCICTILMFVGVTMLTLVSVFFIMSPSWITCAIRKTCFSIAIAFIFAPILVKTIMIWRRDVLMAHGSEESPYASVLTMFCMCMVIVLIQLVIVVEWSLFDDPTQIEFSQFGDKFAWRCSPGLRFEHRILHSMVINIFLIVSSLLCSVLSIRNIESQQNVIISVIALVFGIALYIVLPVLSFTVRDQVFASAMLAYAVLNVILTYCKGVFCRPSGATSNESLVERPFRTVDRASDVSMDKRLFMQPTIFGHSLNSTPQRRESGSTHRGQVPLSYRSSIASEYKMNNFA
uniref:G_PROTEIN_RECEP_F3_4 domain-containing protein n=1 Tax=Panagrellus redivivus TaxID=6233 RepID=A0A7E5A220_PANRE